MACRLKDHVKLLSGGILNKECRCILYIQYDFDKRAKREIKKRLKRQAHINETFEKENSVWGGGGRLGASRAD